LFLAYSHGENAAKKGRKINDIAENVSDDKIEVIKKGKLPQKKIGSK